MYIQKIESIKMEHGLGNCFLTLDTNLNQINSSIVIKAQKPFLYWNKRYENALNSGLINQDVYNAIKENQGENRVIVKLYSNIDINKEELINLIKFHNLDINIKQESFNIIQDLNTQGYQVIKKI
jgi:hypothetical protein